MEIRDSNLDCHCNVQSGLPSRIEYSAEGFISFRDSLGHNDRWYIGGCTIFGERLEVQGIRICNVHRSLAQRLPSEYLVRLALTGQNASVTTTAQWMLAYKNNENFLPKE